MTKLTYKVLIVVLCIAMGGCSLVPYEEDFACRKKDGLGKCISMHEAYDEAVAGVERHPPMVPASEQEDDTAQDKVITAPPISKSGSYDQYIESYYKEIGAIVARPVTPMVKQAKTIRTLVLPYSGTSHDNTLWMERYAYSIIDEPAFVMGQYLTKKPDLLESILPQKGE
ncbi:type IV conjugative transfer system lipoprotein TraV [Pseudoalteromonas luteoviolacea]|uniref:type IV conjugative transfer system lipoprotein TraV n=1 Tax=Pseudoalteromonas luteoviolacea TaxID=43657 RepID=UPI001B36EC75|nr:type IV conjugative transfer system lipoprotein TraV [Pseudoalteromonas luteoviolacea]MBQ4839840.1 type IV conjugative transfer system lipoprotein TraV [Pseudoalteromonas luteoviolacea]